MRDKKYQCSMQHYKEHKVSIAIMTLITTLTIWCMRAYGLNACMVNLHVKKCDIQERKHDNKEWDLHLGHPSLGFWDIREGVT